jgi:hypothetical protein
MANQDHPNTHQGDAKAAETRAPAAPKPDPKAVAAAKEAQAASSIGAQVILDYNGDGSLGARGGLAPTIEENLAGRDAHYLALGLNPMAPSGPPPSMEQRKAHQAAAEAQAKVDAAHATPGSGAASRVSSLAAGLITEPADVPVEPPPSTSGAAAHR